MTKAPRPAKPAPAAASKAAASPVAAPPAATTAQPARGIGWMAAPLVIFGAMAIVFAYALKTGDPSKLPSALLGKPAPALDLKPLDGLVDKTGPVPGLRATDLAAGRVTLVNFFASWCVPCVQEHPYLEEVKRRVGVDLVGINYKDATEAGRRFLGRYGNPYKAVGVDDSGRAAIEWGVYGTPETFVVDGQGRIAYKHVGPIGAEALETQIIPAIEKARKSGSAGATK